MKTEEKIGLASLLGLGLLLLILRPVRAAVSQIGVIPGELVVSVPEDDSPCADVNVLIWGAAVLKKFAAQSGATMLELAASPDNLRSTILEQNPRRLYLFGHGRTLVFTCERCEWFLDSFGLNLDLVAGRYCHLLSCSTAKDLGRKIIGAGATAYFGYCEEFILLIWRTFVSGRFFEAPFYGDIEIEVLLGAGETDLGVIYNGAIKRFNDEIAYWGEHWAEESFNGIPVDEYLAQMLINVLVHNRDILRCYYHGGEYPSQSPLLNI